MWIYTECIQHTFCSFYLFFWLCVKLILIIAGKVSVVENYIDGNCVRTKQLERVWAGAGIILRLLLTYLLSCLTAMKSEK